MWLYVNFIFIHLICNNHNYTTTYILFTHGLLFITLHCLFAHSMYVLASIYSDVHLYIINYSWKLHTQQLYILRYVHIYHYVQQYIPNHENCIYIFIVNYQNIEINSDWSIQPCGKAPNFAATWIQGVLHDPILHPIRFSL